MPVPQNQNDFDLQFLSWTSLDFINSNSIYKRFNVPDAISEGCNNGCHTFCSQTTHSLDKKETRKTELSVVTEACIV